MPEQVFKHTPLTIQPRPRALLKGELLRPCAWVSRLDGAVPSHIVICEESKALGLIGAARPSCDSAIARVPSNASSQPYRGAVSLEPWHVSPHPPPQPPGEPTFTTNSHNRPNVWLARCSACALPPEAVGELKPFIGSRTARVMLAFV